MGTLGERERANGYNTAEVHGVCKERKAKDENLVKGEKGIDFGGGKSESGA